MTLSLEWAAESFARGGPAVGGWEETRGLGWGGGGATDGGRNF